MTSGVKRLLDGGTGAERQRVALADGGTEGLLDLIAPAPRKADGDEGEPVRTSA